MARKLSLLTLVSAMSVAMIMMSAPVRADHCTIAIMKTTKDQLVVTVPDTIYNSEIILKKDQRHVQEPLLGHGSCPTEEEITFHVENCTKEIFYSLHALPSGEYEENKSIPLYTIKGPADENYAELEDDSRCE